MSRTVDTGLNPTLSSLFLSPLHTRVRGTHRLGHAGRRQGHKMRLFTVEPAGTGWVRKDSNLGPSGYPDTRCTALGVVPRGLTTALSGKSGRSAKLNYAPARWYRSLQCQTSSGSQTGLWATHRFAARDRIGFSFRVNEYLYVFYVYSRGTWRVVTRSKFSFP